MAKSGCVVGIAGGSGSGKSTFAHRLVAACGRVGVEGRIFSLDNYYVPLDGLPLARRKEFNFDHPDAIDFPMALRDIRALIGGEAVRQPVYDFKRYTRSKKSTLLEPAPLVVVEGLYALYFKSLLELYDYKLFVSTGIATAVLRRISRDIDERGRDVDGARHQILSAVLPMYESYVKPTQRNAHFCINWEGEEIPDKATEGVVRMVREHFRPAP
jgi:uridine kinase